MTIAAADAAFALGLPPERAIAHLEAKHARVTGPWTDWLDGQHARGFTVANVAKLDVLQDIQDSLARALKGGQTLQQWKDGLVPELQRKGWWGRDGTTSQLGQAGRIDADGVIAKGLTPARLRTIFQTNMQSAYMAGRYAEMIEDAEERPFWQYVAILDAKTRPAHRAMNGRIFRYDDPGWKSFYPPCGYRCRCRVRNHSQSDVARRGLAVESTQGKLGQVEVPLRSGGSATVTRYTDRSMPGGGFQPDAGFSNNPGLDAWQPPLKPLDSAFSRAYVETAVQGPAFARFVQGQDQGVFPVAVLRVAERAALDTDASVAYLSDQTVAKQLRRHPEMTLEDYRRIPDMIELGEAYQQDDSRLIYLADGATLYRLALKTTAGRDELYVVSLFRTSRAAADKEVAQRLRKIGK